MNGNKKSEPIKQKGTNKIAFDNFYFQVKAYFDHSSKFNYFLIGLCFAILALSIQSFAKPTATQKSLLITSWSLLLLSAFFGIYRLWVQLKHHMKYVSFACKVLKRENPEDENNSMKKGVWKFFGKIFYEQYNNVPLLAHIFNVDGKSYLPNYFCL